ncbi:SDR family NAD(P)-dependent oxidoreductase [Prescottella sp. R16]|uniref:SDR family NAD(P)-dependent oxidoreductase n=1 Tax=Prescottella sp. R16 TaxID=3064529 RepID=UPI00272E5DAC|nr:SDR family NAD(P)-dependent oxidoreductase [Prescottella sp. R16]
MSSSSSRPAFRPGPLLTGKSAVVTGGAHGIGAAIARSFAAHGARVLVVDIDDTAAGALAFDAGAGGSIEVLGHDVRETTVPDAVTGFEPDVLVNNVGHFLRPPRLFAETEPDFWAQMGAINLDHVLRWTHAVLPGMAERGRGGSVVNLTTVEAHRAIPGHSVYAAYKAAVTQFGRSLAVETGPIGVRVNAIAPDLIESVQVPYTDMLSEAEWEQWPAWAPLGGPGQSDDVAGAALFLASDLSRYTTGTTVHVDGGTFAAGGWFAKPEGGWTNRPRHA